MCAWVYGPIFRFLSANGGELGSGFCYIFCAGFFFVSSMCACGVLVRESITAGKVAEQRATNARNWAMISVKASCDCA